MTHEELAFVNLQLAGMLRSGIPLEGALRQLGLDMRRGRLRRELEQLNAALANGIPLGEALAARDLPEFYVRMLQAGARNNDLPAVLNIVADYYQRAHLVWTRLKGLMVYPAIVLLAALGLSLFLTFLVAGLIREIPDLADGITDGQGLAGVSARLWAPVTALALVAGALLVFLAVPGLRRAWRWYLPGFKQAAISQVASMLALLLKGGSHLNDALGLVGQMEKGTPAGAEIARWQEQLAAGRGKFAELAVGRKVFPPLFYWLVAGSGEELADGFQRAADVYHMRATHRIELLLYAALPISVLLLGLLIVGQMYPILKVIGSTFRFLGEMGGGIGD
jgi:type II secretory pathway component PulF